MSGEPGMKLGWRLFWAVVGAGLTFTVLSVSGLGLDLPIMIAITVAAGIAVALVGPMLLDLLSLV
ncbi:MAG: hypothetical protein AB1Z98_26640 [Nannocystaceae bacterium]